MNYKNYFRTLRAAGLPLAVAYRVMKEARLANQFSYVWVFLKMFDEDDVGQVILTSAPERYVSGRQYLTQVLTPVRLLDIATPPRVVRFLAVKPGQILGRRVFKTPGEVFRRTDATRAKKVLL